MEYSRFATDRRPWCVWDWDLKGLTRTFSNTFDPTYFEYLVTLHEAQLDGENARHAATAIRTSYFHAMETLFAILAALVQAPDCVPGWIQGYRTTELYQVVEKISRGRSLYSKIRCDRLTWDKLARFIMRYVSLQDKDKERRIKEAFGQLWAHLADEFLSKKSRAEYNSIKHGFRIRSGGSWIAVGVEKVPGVACPPEEMTMPGGSEHGSSFFEPEQFDKHNIQLVRRSTNWDPAYLAGRVRLIAMSLQNIISFLRVVHGEKPESVRFCWPQELDDFREVWQGPALLESSLSITVKTEDINLKTADEILAVYDQTK